MGKVGVAYSSKLGEVPKPTKRHSITLLTVPQEAMRRLLPYIALCRRLRKGDPFYG